MKKAYLEPEVLFLKLHFTILLHLEMQDLVMKVALDGNYTLPEEKMAFQNKIASLLKLVRRIMFIEVGKKWNKYFLQRN